VTKAVSAEEAEQKDDADVRPEQRKDPPLPLPPDFLRE
jgi:hypothetical protein